MKLLLIFNPHAAMNRSVKLLPDICKGLQQFAAVKVASTRHAGHAVELVAAANLGAFDGVIAVGGDGLCSKSSMASTGKNRRNGFLWAWYRSAPVMPSPVTWG